MAKLKSKSPSETPLAPSVASPQQVFTSNAPLLSHLSLTGNLAKKWRNCRQTWQAYETITNFTERLQKYRVATFMTCVGPDAREIHNGFPFKSKEENEDMDKVIGL